LRAGSQTLGREADADLCLPLPAVSRQQLRLTCGPNGCTVENLGRTNPTYLNGQPIAGAVRLRDGDLLGIGHLRLRHRAAAHEQVQPIARGRLVIRQAGRPDRIEPLAAATVTIGRSPECDIVLDYPAVSGRHLRLEWEPGSGYRVIDLHSTHGVAVDGRRVDRPVPLQPGSRIWLGDGLGNGVALIYVQEEAS
jgi:pSer/pThr/pTyr-binding forkhead associated (FHA) protein